MVSRVGDEALELLRAEPHEDGVEGAEGRDVGNRELVVEQVDDGLDLLVEGLTENRQAPSSVSLDSSGATDAVVQEAGEALRTWRSWPSWPALIWSTQASTAAASLDGAGSVLRASATRAARDDDMA